MESMVIRYKWILRRLAGGGVGGVVVLAGLLSVK